MGRSQRRETRRRDHICAFNINWFPDAARAKHIHSMTMYEGRNEKKNRRNAIEAANTTRESSSEGEKNVYFFLSCLFARARCDRMIYTLLIRKRKTVLSFHKFGRSLFFVRFFSLLFLVFIPASCVLEPSFFLSLLFMNDHSGGALASDAANELQ